MRRLLIPLGGNLIAPHWNDVALGARDDRTDVIGP
jgi:hypothetical protein